MKSLVYGGMLILGGVGSLLGEDQVWMTSPSDSELKLWTGSSEIPTTPLTGVDVQPWGVTFDESFSVYFVSDANLGIIAFNEAVAQDYVLDAASVYHGIDADNGNLYALRSGSDDLVVFDIPSTDPVVLASGFERPNDVAVDSGRNRIYVTDSGLDQVRSYDLNGSLTGTWNLNGAWGVAIDQTSGEVYVTSYDDGLLYRKSLGGSSFVSKVSGLDGPRGVEVDRGGRVFVIEANSDRVVQTVPAIGMFFPTIYTGVLNGHGLVYEESTDRDGDFLGDDWERGFSGSLITYNGGNDPEGDGHVGLLEYAFNGDPTAREGALYGDFVQSAGDGFSLSMKVRDDDGLLMNYFVSNDLVGWVEVTPTSEAAAAEAGYNDLEFDVTEMGTLGVETGKLFFKASVQPNR